MAIKNEKQLDPCHLGHQHPDHGAQIKRLNRVIGQLGGVAKMIEQRRYCADILVQTRAAVAAIKKIEASILEAHLKACVQSAFSSGESQADEKIDELVTLLCR